MSEEEGLIVVATDDTMLDGYLLQLILMRRSAAMRCAYFSLFCVMWVMVDSDAVAMTTCCVFRILVIPSHYFSFSDVVVVDRELTNRYSIH